MPTCSQILNKEPAGKIISKNDTFKYNADFTDRMKRIKVHRRCCPHTCGGVDGTRHSIALLVYLVWVQVPLPPVDEKKKVVEDVDKDRRYAVDAAIVRTMKSRKQLQHQQLMLEVVQQLSRMWV